MPLDLEAPTSTPDIRCVPPVQARIVCGLRYVHVARARGTYCMRELAGHLGGDAAVHPLHVLLAEAVQFWPEPIGLGATCQVRMSYDEMLLVDCATAAARGERDTFDRLLCDMVGEADRRSLWLACARLMRALGVSRMPERPS